MRSSYVVDFPLSCDDSLSQQVNPAPLLCKTHPAVFQCNTLRDDSHNVFFVVGFFWLDVTLVIGLILFF